MAHLWNYNLGGPCIYPGCDKRPTFELLCYHHDTVMDNEMWNSAWAEPKKDLSHLYTRVTQTFPETEQHFHADVLFGRLLPSRESGDRPTRRAIGRSAKHEKPQVQYDADAFCDVCYQPLKDGICRVKHTMEDRMFAGLPQDMSFGEMMDELA